ncbi:MAG: FAD-dependent oxidoreductase [Bacilli bacterium]|nr:FAD-dependent oxidoreductase [Bacilli bacterium]
MRNYDVVVIGGGPAGMSAALNLKRMGKSVIILEKEAFGGQIATSPRVENIPGFKEISGLDYSNLFFEQLMDLEVEFELEEVLEVKKDGDLFHIKTNYSEYESKAVVIAAGVTHRHMGVAREEELVGKGVSYCAVCDGAFFKDKDVAVIGDANSALQYALNLTNYCNKVYLCMLFDRFFADNILVNRVLKNEKIIITKEIALQEFLGEDELTGLRFENTKTHEEVIFNVSGVFIAIGQVPHNDLYKNLVDLDKGYIVVNEFMKTKTKGLYAVGDCTKKAYRQVCTAVNDGLIAAISISNEIE